MFSSIKEKVASQGGSFPDCEKEEGFFVAYFPFFLHRLGWLPPGEELEVGYCSKGGQLCATDPANEVEVCDHQAFNPSNPSVTLERDFFRAEL